MSCMIFVHQGRLRTFQGCNLGINAKPSQLGTSHWIVKLERCQNMWKRQLQRTSLAKSWANSIEVYSSLQFHKLIQLSLSRGTNWHARRTHFSDEESQNIWDICVWPVISRIVFWPRIYHKTSTSKFEVWILWKSLVHRTKTWFFFFDLMIASTWQRLSVVQSWYSSQDRRNDMKWTKIIKWYKTNRSESFSLLQPDVNSTDVLTFKQDFWQISTWIRTYSDPCRTTGIWSYQSFLQLPSSYCKLRRLSQWLRRSSPFQRRSNAPPASAQHQDSSCSVESCLHHVVMCPKIRACLTLGVLWCLLTAWHAIKIPFWVLVDSSRKSIGMPQCHRYGICDIYDSCWCWLFTDTTQPIIGMKQTPCNWQAEILTNDLDMSR